MMGVRAAMAEEAAAEASIRVHLRDGDAESRVLQVFVERLLYSPGGIYLRANANTIERRRRIADRCRKRLEQWPLPYYVDDDEGSARSSEPTDEDVYRKELDELARSVARALELEAERKKHRPVWAKPLALRRAALLRQRQLYPRSAPTRPTSDLPPHDDQQNARASVQRDSCRHSTLTERAIPICFSWQVDQVCDWLCSSGFTQYEPAFRLNGIDGRRLIFVASAASLASMRVSGTELTHARALAKQVRVLLGLDDDDHGRLRSVADAPAPPLQLFLERVAREGDSFQARSGAFQRFVSQLETGSVKIEPPLSYWARRY